jgi:hypothetical protein
MLTNDRINDICDGWAVPHVVVLPLHRRDYTAWYVPRSVQYASIRRSLPADVILLKNRRDYITIYHELAHHIVFHEHAAPTLWHLHSARWQRTFARLLIEELHYSPSQARRIVKKEMTSGRACNEHPEAHDH